ncbi:unnamed protein product [Phytophthora lilii]|uniref:Unnamed protein product n=1 Tax=Phytophthora lilii TaxID=2077276 RepID=A0A9W6XL54_9STRA|nr:unnamed protein product [Phytophthora lilii]
MIALVPDCKFSKEMKEQGVLVIQPSIALANIATRMALLEQNLAEALSNEISTTSDFSTASYFLRPDTDRGSFSEMHLESRRLALGRSVVNHHSVDYDRLMEALRAENLPMPPPPSRVAMFGTSSAAGFDPFTSLRDNGSSFFVMHDDTEEVEEILLNTPNRALPRTRTQRRISISRSSRFSGVSASGDIRHRVNKFYKSRQALSLLTLTLVTSYFANGNPVLSSASYPHIRHENEDNLTTRQLSTDIDDDKIVPFNSWGNAIDTLQYALAFIVVLVAAHPLGLYFPKLFKLPLITGYLVIGIIAGPFVANLLTEGLVNMLSNYVSALALSFISFQAGQEIYLPELRPQLKSIFILLGALYVTAMIILTAAILITEEAFFYSDMGFNCQLGIALMFGSISVLGSPATVMAIKIELNSVGPFTSLMLGATMTAEFIVLVSFSISRIVCSIYCAKLDVSMLNLMYTMSIVLANIVVGMILAAVIILIFKIPGGEQHHDEHLAHGEAARPSSKYYDQRTNEKVASVNPDMTPHPHNGADECTVDELQHTPSGLLSPKAALSLKGFIWLSMGYVFYISTTLVAEATAAAFGLSWEIKFEPLLVLMIASCIAGHYSAIRHDMHVILDTVAPYMFLPFFVMTGAALKLDQVVAAIPLMSLYVVLRYVAIFIACYFGGRFLLKLTPRQYNNLWLTMTPQAGVALGLANEVKAMSDESWAAEFAATIVAAVVVNQIIGPVLCAMGLSRAGETLQDRMVEGNESKDDVGSIDMSVRSSHLSSFSQFEVTRQMSRASTIVNPTDPRALLPFYKVKNAVVIGDDEVAFEVALELSLYGAHVNVPLLDEERTSKWKKMNETILQRAAKGDLISVAPAHDRTCAGLQVQ